MHSAVAPRMESSAPASAPTSASTSAKKSHAGVEPCTFVLFGASGDLARRKLMPALYRLAQEGGMPAETALVGAANQDLSPDAYRAVARDAVERALGPVDNDAWRAFARRLHYLQVDVSCPEDYARLGALLAALERGRSVPGNRLLYLALAPGLHAAAATHLGALSLHRSEAGGWGRLVVEKPFGTDLASARALNRVIHRAFDEASIYRMDHYLGKEMVQNLLFLRFSNRLFEPLWNREHVHHVEITCAETAGVEGRGGYYEQAGVVRDMIQNHAFQLAALTAMEAPEDFSPEAIHDAKVAAMERVRPFTDARIQAECVRGQYGAGVVAGREVAGYREEAGVAKDSTTDTFALLTMRFDTPRWAGVPFYVRSGKRLAENCTEVRVHLREGPLGFIGGEGTYRNRLVFRIQPDAGVSLRFATRAPGSHRLQEASLDFSHAALEGAGKAEAYERLLLDCMRGVSTHYVRNDLVEQAWEIVTPVLDAWAEPPAVEGFPNYAAGSLGPAEALRILGGK